ncbi:ribosomal lysine N-methyltransferase [Lachancea thermotolerans CBS 6340]|uniref:Ribosomal lysine N-methyltransferase 4 n=1 Tax=Lachancea thermotolerans (strain ATCC 56472 / CBS 6340 / NRRL Y-8284) TaxID=559295 RepID=C5DH85_LACTC|nr:KLTH0E02156p [Lachancea thermotolerans CBS 6340]CAR23146.1 KLTH0E02156p [Lachancea thermotolerans CBS 6340]
MDTSEFETKTNNFLRWASKDAKLWISDKVKLLGTRDGDQGRYMVATQEIIKGEKLFEVPRGSALNVATLSLSMRDKQVYKKLTTEVGHWEGLVIAILYEFKVMNQNSKWWPYFEVLPEPARLNSLMYWTGAELEYLKPSGVYERVDREGAEEMYARVMKCAEDLKITELTNITWEEFMHVASIIMAYSFDMERPDYEDSDEEVEESDEEEEEEKNTVWNDGYFKSMVPMADMLNSDTHKCNANLTYSPEALIMVAVADIPSGEQIYNNYGEYPNSELLRRYGYVEWSGSKFDCGEMPLETLLKAIEVCLEAPRRLIDKLVEILSHDNDIVEDILEGEPLVMESYDCFLDGQVVPECATLVQILTIALQLPDVQQYDEKTLSGYLQRIIKRAIKTVNSVKITKKCLQVWKTASDARLQDYPSHSFREPSPDHVALTGDSLRRRMAECVLQSEVQSFQNCFSSLEQRSKVIEDQQLLDMVLKRKQTAEKGSQKQQKRLKK